ncbi:MAG TPA: efflux RND transporter periplasmic adaptor subunit [Pseudomonadales bacterium]|nr:efflux RND transporter periplasmic adaptor subunit [Pseudomonadales bacterium]
MGEGSRRPREWVTRGGSFCPAGEAVALPRLPSWRVLLRLCVVLLAPCAAAQAAPAPQVPAVDCIITPSQVVDLSSPVAGVIAVVEVERSDEVVVGQVVARLDASIERATVELARARTHVDPQIQAERINLEFDNLRKDRIDSLFGRNAISRTSKDEADRDVELSRWRMQQAKDLQEIRRLELQRAEQQLEQKTIRSTIDGFVVERFKTAGEYVEDQAIVRIAKIDPLKIEAILPIRFFGTIRPGRVAEVVPETMPGSVRPAHVTVVDRMGDAASGTFAVTLEMDNPGQEVPAGLKCDLRFSEPAQYVALAPRTAPAVPGAVPATGTRTVPEAGAAADAPVGASWVLGPFHDEGAVEAARASLGDVDSRARAESVAAVGLYRVFTPPLTEQAREAAVARLADGGVRDFMIMGAGAWQGRIALGAFRAEANARERRDAVRALGVAAELLPPADATVRWWLDVRGDPAVAHEAVERLARQGVSVADARVRTAVDEADE